MAKRRTKSADVAKVTKAIASSRNSDFLPASTPKTGTSDDGAVSLSVNDTAREGIRLGFLIHDVSRMRRSAYDQFMKPLGITRAQWWVLAHLSRHDGMMQTQLADVLEVGKASLGDVIESLEGGGWVQRRPDPADKRAKRVYLTKPAQTLIKRMTVMENDFNSQILADLSDEELTDVVRVLIKIKHAISRLAPSAVATETATGGLDRASAPVAPRACRHRREHPMPTTEQQQRELRVAARALSRGNLVHAYGHCSRRLDAHEFLVCAAKPMGTLLPGDAGTVVPVSGALPGGVLGEVRIHQAIYARRPDVGAICRIMPPQVGLLALLRRTPRPRHGFGAYFAPGPALWDDPRLLRDDDAAARLADLLGGGNAIVMRANGAVVVGENLVEAVALSWFLEEAARVEVGLMQMNADGDHTLLTPDETAARQVTAGRVYERMWDYLSFGDAEA